MLRVFVLYALSGFVSLGYQVAWFRIFTDWFGSTNLSFALVVCSFIGGLGAGALASAPLTRLLARISGLTDRLRLYGAFEILIGLAVLLTVAAAWLPTDLWGSFPYHLRDGIWVQDLGYRLAQAGVAVACVFVPCLLMGVTFPLLCDAFVAAPGGERFPAALYAWNTLGACTGVLACQFLLLPWIGHGITLWLMVGLNLLIGLWFVVTGGDRDPAGPPPVAGPVAPAAGGAQKMARAVPADSTPAAAGPPLPAGLLLLATLSGLLAGAIEGDLFRRISFVLPNNPGALMPLISFWAILAIFLASTTVHRWTTLRLSHIKVAFVIGGLAYYGLWRLMYPLSAAWSPRLDDNPTAMAFSSVAMFPTSMLQLLLFTGILVFLPFFLNSLLLPWVCNRLQADRRHLGVAYGLNTLAFCAGLIGFTLVAPLVSIFYSLKLMLVLLACGAGLLLLLPERRPLSPWLPAGAAALFVAGCFAVPGGFDAGFMRPGSDPARYPVESVMSDGAHTTFVLRKPGDDRLYFGNLSMSGTNLLAQAYMRLMAHVPLLAQETPTRALLICFGVGNTASAIAVHDSIRQIDIVDLNANVFRTAPAFSATHFNVHLDPRVRLIHDDGRNFLRHTDQTYDLITSEPPPPMAAGVYRLYSREYYAHARDRLSPTGIMSQWLPIYQMPIEAVELAIATFIDVFPNAILYVGLENELLLIGGRGDLDLERIAARYASLPAVREDLQRIGVSESHQLFARIMMDDDSLRRRYGTRTPISDQHNQLDQLLLTPRNLAFLPYDPVEALDYVAQRSPALAADMQPVVTHLGRLRYQVASFPLQRVRQDPAVSLSDVDWQQVDVLQRRAGALDRRGERAGAVELVLQGLRAAPEQPALITWVADRLQALGRAAEAVGPLKTFVRLEPEDATARWQLASALYAAGRAAEAIPHLAQASALRPGWVEPLNNLAWILAAHPEPGVRDGPRALALARQVESLTAGRDPGVLYTLAAAQAAAGQPADAASTARRALALIGAAPAGSPGDALAQLLRSHLARYERGLTVTDPALATRG